MNYVQIHEILTTAKTLVIFSKNGASIDLSENSPRARLTVWAIMEDGGVQFDKIVHDNQTTKV